MSTEGSHERQQALFSSSWHCLVTTVKSILFVLPCSEPEPEWALMNIHCLIYMGQDSDQQMLPAGGRGNTSRGKILLAELFFLFHLGHNYHFSGHRSL